MPKFTVEVTKTETRTFSSSVEVESNLTHDTGELDEFEARWEDDVRDKAAEAALELSDDSWEETTDERGPEPSIDTGEIEEVQEVPDAKV